LVFLVQFRIAQPMWSLTAALAKRFVDFFLIAERFLLYPLSCLGDAHQILQPTQRATAVIPCKSLVLESWVASTKQRAAHLACRTRLCVCKLLADTPISPAYVRQAASQAGWSQVLQQESVIRYNAGQPVWGSLFILQRSS